MAQPPSDDDPTLAHADTGVDAPGGASPPGTTSAANHLVGWRAGDRYEVVRPIAAGGVATVFEARDVVLDRPVALKVLHPHLAHDDVTNERFRREALTAARFTHPNAVKLYDVGRETDTSWLAMEFIDGPDLGRILLDHGPLDVSVAVAIGEQVARALAVLHEAALIHRDVKPGNVLLARSGVVKVGDFGIARAVEATTQLTQAGTVIGSASYLAPEQLEGGDVDARVDVFALGVVLWQALTGERPYQRETAAATAIARLTQELPAISDFRADVPSELTDIVLTATRRDRDERFRDAGEFVTALGALLDDRAERFTAALVGPDRP